MAIVTVVIPTYNRAREIERCLKSLKTQTFQNFEVFIYDDGSTDTTSEVVKNFDASFSVTFVQQPNSGGPAKGRNEGIRASKSKYIAFLDSDDWWKPRKLEKSIFYLEQGFDLVYHDLHRSPTNPLQLGRKKVKSRKINKSAYEHLLRRGNSIPNSSVVVKRSLIQEVGPIDESKELVAAEDFDLWIRLAEAGCTFKRMPFTLGYYQIGVDSISTSERVLKYLDFLNQKYLQQEARQFPIWFLLARGSAFLNMGENREARIDFLKALLTRGDGLELRNRIAALHKVTTNTFAGKV